MSPDEIGKVSLPFVAERVVGAFSVKPDVSVLDHGPISPAVRDQVQGIGDRFRSVDRRLLPSSVSHFPGRIMKVNRYPQMLGNHSRVVTLVAVESVNYCGEGAHLGIG